MMMVSTNEYEHIHLDSHHNAKIKNGMIIGFYVRDLRICTPNFFYDEFD